MGKARPNSSFEAGTFTSLFGLRIQDQSVLGISMPSFDVAYLKREGFELSWRSPDLGKEALQLRWNESTSIFIKEAIPVSKCPHLCRMKTGGKKFYAENQVPDQRIHTRRLHFSHTERCIRKAADNFV